MAMMHLSASIVGALLLLSNVASFSPVVKNLSRNSNTRLFDAEEPPEILPITLLSGFLGSGKTVTLKHLLENKEGVKIGVIVNDLASVNIDAKLIAAQQDGVVELQNGCACCSLSAELVDSVEALLTKQKDLDALVVELSGVADPNAIKANWRAAQLQGHPTTRKTNVAKVVTLVDACTFGSDWMTQDLAVDREGWLEEEDCAGSRQVTELLAEQVESADVVLVNKVDMATPEEVKIATTVAKGINDKAQMEQVSFGQITPNLVLGDLIPDSVKEEESLDHAHDHACSEPDCTDTSHSHSHGHADPAECADPDCTDTSHSHSHAHGEESECADPDCTDTSHSHSHSHNTDTDNLGITNFVYARDRPFHTKRLLELLNSWPVPNKENLDLELLQEASLEGYSVDGRDEGAVSPFVGVVRSKGFVWLAPNKWMGANDDAYRHDTAMYWSHAGKHFGITAAGKWWGTISTAEMIKYFPDVDEYNKIIKNDFVTEEWGDRRQELVFIGVEISEKAICDALDKCLLLNIEMEQYRKDVENHKQLVQNMNEAGLFEVDAQDF